MRQVRGPKKTYAAVIGHDPTEIEREFVRVVEDGADAPHAFDIETATVRELEIGDQRDNHAGDDHRIHAEDHHREHDAGRRSLPSSSAAASRKSTTGKRIVMRNSRMLFPRNSASATVKSEKRPSRKSESAAQVPGCREEGHQFRREGADLLTRPRLLDDRRR